MPQRRLKSLVRILTVSMIALVGIGVFWQHLALAQSGDEPTTQASPEALPGDGPETLQSLPPGFDWAAYAEYEARLTQCEMIDALEWLPGKVTRTVQIQRCVGPGPDIFLENPNLESLPPAENVPVPPMVEPAMIEANSAPSE